jgi:hypothetical protein
VWLAPRRRAEAGAAIGGDGREGLQSKLTGGIMSRPSSVLSSTGGLEMFWTILTVAVIGGGLLQSAGSMKRDSHQQKADAVAARQDRDELLWGLQRRAQARIDDERLIFSAAELADIEARYASARSHDGLLFRRPGAEEILLDLVRRYPRSNRAGCALLDLAQMSTGARREGYLRQAIGTHDHAWFPSGVQVGALARAMLAVHLAGLERFDEAERWAAELVKEFPGSVDQSGATLDDTLTAIRLLRVP